ncbi:hypothetical protein SDD30_07955 [Moorella naiadis]
MLSWIYGRDLHGVYHDIIECLTATLEARDPYSEEHSQRVADMALTWPGELGLKAQNLRKYI